MAWQDIIQTILDSKTDSELGVSVNPDAPPSVNINEIDIDLAIQMVVDGATDWQVRKAISDSSGRSITANQVKIFRALVKIEQRERDLALNPPEEIV